MTDTDTIEVAPESIDDTVAEVVSRFREKANTDGLYKRLPAGDRLVIEILLRNVTEAKLLEMIEPGRHAGRVETTTRDFMDAVHERATDEIAGVARRFLDQGLNRIWPFDRLSSCAAARG